MSLEPTDRSEQKHIISAVAPEPVEDHLIGDVQSGLARSAMLLSVGNIASRVLGLVREMVISRTFLTAEVSAFTVASQVPTLLYDFLIGGMLSAALVPVLSDYAERGRREFAHLVSLLITIFATLLALISIALYWLAPQVADLLTADTTTPSLLLLTAQLIRQIVPAVWLFGMAGILTAVLYALRRFTWPALATALYNLGVVVAVPLLAPRFGITSLVVGILLGAFVQFALMSWDLRRVALLLRPQFQWHHPALWRIVRLYLPISAGLLVSLFQVGLDRNLASSTGPDSIAWMRYATTLQQLPLGLISVAIALASLPQLSHFFAAGNEEAYRRTLGQGLRMVLLLLLPSAVMLWLLGEPVARLVFGSRSDLAQIVAALQIYLVGMLFAAIDFPLNYAFYARHNTLLPALVGLFSVGIYVVVAFWLLRPLGYLGLVWADTAKQASHALVMILLLAWHVGRLHAHVRRGLLQMGGAAFVMAAIIAPFVLLIGPNWPTTWFTNAGLVLGIGGVGLLGYVAVLGGFKLRELTQLQAIARSRLGI